MYYLRLKAFFYFLCLSFACVVSPSIAEVYKYKDAKGRWVYTDKKPVSEKGAVVDESVTKKNVHIGQGDRSKWEDLQTTFQQQYSPVSAIEQATLAVVKIETILGVGSGFFMTEFGHIVTNRHVVRPHEYAAWKEVLTDLDDEEKRFKRQFKSLKKKKKRLAVNKQELDDLYHEIENLNEYERPITRTEYEYRERRYHDKRKKYAKAYKKANRDYKAFSARKKDTQRRGMNAAVARNFTVILKDGRKVQAQLLKLSNKQDIAILKLTGYLTPYLAANEAVKPVQTMKVYAIGSPLGQSDSVTSGIISRMEDESIITGATILPGNSGGPLIDENG